MGFVRFTPVPPSVIPRSCADVHANSGRAGRGRARRPPGPSRPAHAEPQRAQRPGALLLHRHGRGPLTALLFNGPLTILGAGWAGPAAFLVATVILAIFTVGYVEMAKRVTTAGGFYSFVSHGFGRTLGLGTAALITFVYVILTASIVGIFAYFANASINDWFGLDIPVWILLFGVIAVWALFALLNIQITAKVLGVFFLAEVVGALVLAFADRLRRRRQRADHRTAQPGEAVRQPGRGRGSSAPRRRASRSSSPSGRGSATRWPRSTAKSPRSPGASCPRPPSSLSSSSASSTPS